MFYNNNIKDVKAILAPDIVYYLDNYSFEGKRKVNAIAFIMRDDKEKDLNLEFQNMMICKTKELFKELYFYDTCDVNFQNDNAQQLLEEYIFKLYNLKIAVTDRLHGMILCYISRTPCIVIDNNNGKIKSTFDTWMQKQNFIRMFNPNEGIERYLRLIHELKNIEISCDDIVEEFIPLRILFEGR